MKSIFRTGIVYTLLIGSALGQSKLPPTGARTYSDPSTYAPDPNEKLSTSELRDYVARYAADRNMIQRLFPLYGSQTRLTKLRAFYNGWLQGMPKVNFEKISQEGKVDYLLLRTRIEHDRTLIDNEAKTLRTLAPLAPFAENMASLQEARQRLEFIKPEGAISALQAISGSIKTAQAAVSGGSLTATKENGLEAARLVESLRGGLEEWFNFYNGYDPKFTAVVPPLYATVNTELTQYEDVLREKLGGLTRGAAMPRSAVSASRGAPARGGQGGGGGRGGAGRGGDDGVSQPLALGQPIVGTPVGRDVLLEELRREMIAYTPEQLIEIGNREYAWCENEMKKASRDMGFGDNWRGALEKVKGAYVPPGEQPELVRNLQIQAETFVREHDMITIPAFAHDLWRMNMMPPARMRTAPFFLGGESILVSYPVVGMAEDLATMIMKGNGPHLSHATVFHELIPGHELQLYTAARFNTHRSIFSTPFYVEGWALHWEMLLWDLGFHATPEDKIGALFWRMHRAARIIFTMNYQMGRWSPAKCVDFLVSNGHERYTAEGEVRGHVQGSAPLYQISYLMGALQLHSVYNDLVVKKKTMTTKQFNDKVIRTGPIPMDMVRALMTNMPLARDYRTTWKFYGDVPDAKDAQ